MLVIVFHLICTTAGLDRYGWVAHDGETFGRQELLDRGLNLGTSWIKNAGGGWSARVVAHPRSSGNDIEPYKAVSLFLYVATEDGSPVSVLDTARIATALRQQTAVDDVFRGKFSGLGGPWALHVHGGDGITSNQGGAMVHSMSLRTPHLHNLTDAVRGALWGSVLRQQAAGSQQIFLSLPNEHQKKANVVVLQITAALPFTLEIVFQSGRGIAAAGGMDPTVLKEGLVGQALGARLQTAESAFESRFKETFGDLDSEDDLPVGTAQAARAALSNLLGGIGYWHGSSLVKISSPSEENQQKVVPLWEASLFSATPSRSFFPRGFLWDEGFHQLLIRQWSPALSRDILAHWLDLMTLGGWIPREQILGQEARARVPIDFIPQSPDAANPPTLFLTLANAMSTENDIDFLRAAWPRLLTWYAWYNTSQAGPIPGSYRWRGRDAETYRELNPKTLTSGLDDFPRASHPASEERHVDLRCWMALAAKAMADIGVAVAAPQSEIDAFTEDAARLADYEELKKLHWDEERSWFADWGNHTQDVALRRPAQGNDLVRAVVGEPPQPQYVPHYGYVSLFPLAMGLIPETAPELKAQLEKLRRQDLLWTPYGLRSLAATSTLYAVRNTEHDPPYWRGAIWMNLNYLVLDSLRRYGGGKGPTAGMAKELATDLRQALLNVVIGQYNEKGYVYEQYDDKTGQGKGSHPFTGWSALMVLVASNKRSP